MAPTLEEFTSASSNSSIGKSNKSNSNQLHQPPPPPPPPPPQQQQRQHDPLASVFLNGATNATVAAPNAITTAAAAGDQAGATDNSFTRMLDQIETAFSRSDSSVDVDELWRVLELYESKLADWAMYAYYDMRKYKRNLVAEYDKYNVMIICWGPGSQSCIHDHSGSHCFMKMLDGELIESRFAWPNQKQILGVQSQEMCRLSDTLMKKDDVLYINDKVGLHLVGNPNLNKTAASLHVYIPPYRKCKAFDQRTGRAQQCEISFHSKCGRVVTEEDQAGWLE